MQDASKSSRIAEGETVLSQLCDANYYNSERTIHSSMTRKRNHGTFKK